MGMISTVRILLLENLLNTNDSHVIILFLLCKCPFIIINLVTSTQFFREQIYDYPSSFVQNIQCGK